MLKTKRINSTSKGGNRNYGYWNYELDSGNVVNRMEPEVERIDQDKKNVKIHKNRFFDAFYNLKKMAFRDNAKSGEFYLTYNASTQTYRWKKVGL